MVDDIRATERELGNDNGGHEDKEETSQPAAQHQLDTEPAVHYDGIAEWVADGDIAVKGHGSQEEELSNSQEEIEEGLYETSCY